ncbi:MAG: hypothetical protein GXP09_00465 [Gammaproteobacteria bacterium]|nr:hypothetical protein [Gammaproteobacteria bacterium]
MNQTKLQALDREQNLLDKACEFFHKTTGLRVVIEQLEPAKGADAFGYLKNGGVETPVLIEVKHHPTKAVVGAIAQQFKQYPEKGMLVADYINPLMADRLKELNIWFMDTVGNAYINEPPVLVYVKGNRPEQKIGKMPKRRAFQPTGLKVVFAFLCNPELVNAPYRDIAHAADVALGTVGWVVTDLKDLGHLVDMGKKRRRLKGLKKLFERWVEAYPDQLRPKLLIGRFTTNEKVWKKNVKLQNLGGYMGGEIAAEYLTHYLIPEFKTVYVRGRPQGLQLAFKMRKDPNGEIELLETFWNVECDWIDNKIVHPILIYADLLATGDPRNIETADMIYEKEIARHFREN